MLEGTHRTELSELGEFGLIAHLKKQVALRQESSVLGIGDDAAIVDHQGLHTVVTTDMLIEGIHFDLAYTPLKHLGYKAVVVNLSDIYAMNAEARQITLSIGLSNRFSVEAIDELFEGINLACRIYNVDLVGGDTCASPSGLVISITALGAAKEETITRRSGASSNDLIVVSGDLGGAFVGLQLLEREKRVFSANEQMQPDLDGKDYILERQLKPEARKDVLRMFTELELQPSSMIDISDGLASEVIHLCVASQTGCKLYEEKIPIDPTVINTARDFNLDPTTCALNGGEDYELLFTIGQGDYDKVKGSPHLTVIGHMTEESAGRYLLDAQGGAHEIKAQGWDAFIGEQD
jgi:thiamine-monophosphate kinase